MLEFVIDSSICLAAFLIFYKLGLEKNSKHSFKRFYLISGLILSALIPLINFTNHIQVRKMILPPVAENFEIISTNTPAEIPWLSILLLGYLVGLAFFLFRFFRNLNSLISETKSNPQIKKLWYSLVLMEKSIIPYSFMNFIFVNKSDIENNEIPDSVLFHEGVHIKQKHSWDILFVEFIHCLFWFNPLFIWLKKEIQMNHEYLADEAVLNAGYEAKKYQTELLKFSKFDPSPQLSHSLHFNPLKKRLKQMKNQNFKKSKKNLRRLTTLLIIPLVGLLILAFAETTTVFTLISDHEATKKEIVQYNRLAKYYANPDGKNIVIQKDEIDFLKLIYANMTEEQKKTAEPFPELPEILPYELNPVKLERESPHDPPRPPWRVIDLQYETDATFFLNQVESSYEEILEATENPPFPVTIQYDKTNRKFMVYTDGTKPGC